MRTGAIFARGSCRALKWLALVGMVLALGAGQAAAQISVVKPPTKFTEGDPTTITVEFAGRIAASSENASEIHSQGDNRWERRHQRRRLDDSPAAGEHRGYTEGLHEGNPRRHRHA